MLCFVIIFYATFTHTHTSVQYDGYKKMADMKKIEAFINGMKVQKILQIIQTDAVKMVPYTLLHRNGF